MGLVGLMGLVGASPVGSSAESPISGDDIQFQSGSVSFSAHAKVFRRSAVYTVVAMVAALASRASSSSSSVTVSAWVLIHE